MGERLMGIETEYAISALYPDSVAYDRSELVGKLLGLARDELINLPDVCGGIYLENGARFYLDYGNHPELTTPECTDPWDIVRYVLAGERILSSLVRNLARNLGIEVMVFKSNVDYSTRWATWGCHESYMHQASPSALSDQIIPHLVTRIIYTGAGGFNSQSSGLEFTLSPRVPHLASVVSNNSTSDRGIFHTKDESLAGPGFHRLHLICGESLCSETAMWLKVATTMLVVAMAEAGLRPGGQVGLRSPLAAMKTIASDPSCSALVETTRGRGLSALEIQYHYLTQAERHLGDSRMPAWAEDVCLKWREILNSLLEAPESVAANLDWGIKRKLYASYAESRGIKWEWLPEWNRALRDVRLALDETAEGDFQLTPDLIRHKLVSPDWATARLSGFLERNGLGSDGLDILFKLRQELLEIDMRFGQLGGTGVFTGLDRAGVLSHHVPGVERIDEAITTPPAIARARIRGEVIRRLAAQDGDYYCDWQGILDLGAKRLLDLSGPFESVERWVGYEQAGSNWPHAFAALAMSLEGSQFLDSNRNPLMIRRTVCDCR
ncbi:MAG TPA: proteasome accessory factor PafA2 family protein [Blastocatellia bacterium]|nr:proteasome accessory factor PafA2 family protein [Blastocatellia bacterium]